MKLNFGTAGKFHIHLEWRDDYGTDGPIGKTWGNLQLWIEDTLVWGQLDSTGAPIGITWSWIDLLEFLGNSLPYLIEEEQQPIVFGSHDDKPRHLGQLRGMTKLRASHISEAEADDEDERLSDFLMVHDFSEALEGAFPPKLLFLRRGRQMLAATTRQEFVLPFDDTISTLESIGDAIFDRIAGLTDARSEIARTRWTNRSEMPNLQRLQIATQRDEASLRRIWPVDVDILSANDAVYELKAAARMIGRRLTDEQLKYVLETIHFLPKAGYFSLTDLWEKSLDVILAHDEDAPAMQGYFLATMLREYLGNADGRVEPDIVLRAWGVVIKNVELTECGLDAIAVWSARHAPTILRNTAGPRSQHPTGLRSTLAHEMCHILVDLDGALPVADVLGGDVPRIIEKRANAFAAEFLMPRSVVRDYITSELTFVLQQDQRNTVIEESVDSLVAKYGASHETTAWQVLNSGCIRESDEFILLKHFKSVSAPFGHEDGLVKY
jgi:Zn-dependent peptidase ImmA (M78 family)